MRTLAAALVAASLLAACATDVKAPTANAGADRRVPLGQVVHLDGSASTAPDGLGVSYTWSFRSIPSGSAAALNNVHVVSPSFTADATGDFVVDLTVTNGAGLGATDSVTITADPSVGVVTAGPAFTVSTVAVGATFLLNTPRGVASDGAGSLYVAETAGTLRITRIHAGQATVVAQRGYLTALQDLVWDGARVIASTGNSARLVAVSTDGAQTPVVDTSLAGTPQRYFGLFWSSAAPARLVVAETQAAEALIFDPAAWATAPVVGSTFQGNIAPWGVAFNGTDTSYGTNNTEVWRGTSTTATRIARGGLIAAARKLLLTACTTPKLLVASSGAGAVVALDAACTTTDCANATAKAVVTGLGTPSGMAWDGADLVVTDESLNAVFRVTGDFCTL
jgi:hypothetical protein